MGACGAEPIPPPIVWEGEHLRFGTDADESELCAGTLPYLDGAVGYLGEVFHVSRPSVDYYWMPDGVEPFCAEGALGCGSDEGVFSRLAIHQHELVHGVRHPRTMALPFEEGLAEAFGDDWAPPYDLSSDTISVLRDPAEHFPGNGYGRAGHYMSYLLATYGLDTVLELESNTSYHGTGSAHLERAFEDVFGQSLESSVTEYERDYPRCKMRTYRNKMYDCSRQVVAAPTTIGDTIEHIVSMKCDDPTVAGLRSGHRWTTVSLEIAEPSRYYIVVGPHDSPAMELMEIRRCDASCFDYENDVINSTTGYEIGAGFCLEPGRYLFRFAIDEDLEGEYSLNVTRTENYTSCNFE